MTTVRTSMLSIRHQQYLREVLDSLGIALPSRSNASVTLRVFNDAPAASRQRSVTPSRAHVRSRSLTPSGRGNRSAAPASHKLNSMSREFRSFFTECIPQFRCVGSWQFKPMAPATVITRTENIISFFAACVKASHTAVSVNGLLVKYFQEKLGLRSLVEYNVLDLLGNVLELRKSVMEIDTFVRVMNGFYDVNDVVFVDYVRTTLKPIANQLLSLEDCERVVERVFGSQQAAVGDAVLGTLRAELADVPTASIDTGYFIYISTWVFHHHRLDLDVRSSVHGFEDVVRQSIEGGGWHTGGEKDLINSYVDSILLLKDQTRRVLQEQQQQVRVPSPQGNALIDPMERKVNDILAQACVSAHKRVDPSTLARADEVMQTVMRDDYGAFLKLVGQQGNDTLRRWTSAVTARDNLIRSTDDGVEGMIKKFCDIVVQATTSKGDSRGVSTWFTSG